MSQWLARRSTWQYLVITWAIAATSGLLGVMTASWSGLVPHAHLADAIEPVALSSLCCTAGAAWGRRLRKRTNARSLGRRGCLAGATSLLVKTLPGGCAWSRDGQGAAGGLWRRAASHELRGRPRRR